MGRARRGELARAGALAVATVITLTIGPISASTATATSEAAPITQSEGDAIPGSYIVVLNTAVDGTAVAEENGISPTFVYTSAISGFSAERRTRATPSNEWSEKPG